MELVQAFKEGDPMQAYTPCISENLACMELHLLPRKLVGSFMEAVGASMEVDGSFHA